MGTVSGSHDILSLSGSRYIYLAAELDEEANVQHFIYINRQGQYKKALAEKLLKRYYEPRRFYHDVHYLMGRFKSELILYDLSTRKCEQVTSIPAVPGEGIILGTVKEMKRRSLTTNGTTSSESEAAPA